MIKSLAEGKMTMIVDVTPQSHKLIKNALSKLLPQVKSSHRAEALARGLGMRTNAALISRYRKEPFKVYCDNKAFNEYMNAHNFEDMERITLEQAVIMAIFPNAEQELTKVLSQYSTLGANGFEKIDAPRAIIKDGFRITDAQQSCLREMSAFVTCKKYLETTQKAKTSRDGISSYALKHKVEKWHEQHYRAPQYVPNGIFIAAAISEGFSFFAEGKNAYFDIVLPDLSPKNVDKIYELIADWARIPTWFTNHQLDRWRFETAMEMLMENMPLPIEPNDFRAALALHAEKTPAMLGTPTNWDPYIEEFTEKAMSYLGSETF